MSTEPAELELDRLRERHPGWLVTTLWAAAAPGEDRRVYAAQRHGIVVCDLSPDGLSAKIAAEDARLPASR